MNIDPESPMKIDAGDELKNQKTEQRRSEYRHHARLDELPAGDEVQS